VPLARLLTPNQFELEKLTGFPITSVDAALDACSQLHSVGVETVVCTRSLRECAKKQTRALLISEQNECISKEGLLDTSYQQG
jgi:pyridoxal/pyridoxine/pyridoxamine kinase